MSGPTEDPTPAASVYGLNRFSVRDWPVYMYKSMKEAVYV